MKIIDCWIWERTFVIPVDKTPILHLLAIIWGATKMDLNKHRRALIG